MSTFEAVEQVSYDLTGPEFRADPYPTLHRIRAEDPVHRSPELRAWLVTRYADVVAGLEHQAVSADRVSPRMAQFPEDRRAEFEPLADVLGRWPLMLDRPEHGRFRPLINKVTAGPLIRSFRPLIEEITAELLDRVEPGVPFDFVREVAVPLPLYVTSRLLGVPREAFDVFKRCAVDIVDFFGTPPATYLPTAGRALESVVEAAAVLRPVIAERRRAPQDDLISGLLQARDGAGISEEEIVATCIMMVFAGFETTTNLLGNALLLLLRNPDQLALLREHPELLRGAVDEALRCETPVQRLSRTTRAEVELGGRLIPPGELVFFMASAANRDPEAFDRPDVFDIRRSAARGGGGGSGGPGHLAFGHWIHTCPGSTLAHLEAEIVLAGLLRRHGSWELATDEVDWHANLSVRALRRLPVRFG